MDYDWCSPIPSRSNSECWTENPLGECVSLTLERRQGRQSASKSKSLVHYIRRRELCESHRARQLSSVPKAIVEIHRLPSLIGISINGVPTLADADKTVEQCLVHKLDPQLLGVAPDGRWAVKKTRIDCDGRGMRMFYFYSVTPAQNLLEHSLYLEDISSLSQCQLTFARADGLAGVLSMDLGHGDSSTPKPVSGSMQGLFRVDLLVPAANAQISTICAVNFQQRLNSEDKKPIHKRYLRVHSRGAIVNGGYHIVFLTVTGRPLMPLQLDWAPRKTWIGHPKRMPHGVVYRENDSVEEHIKVEIGETISARYAFPFLSRNVERAGKYRLSLKECAPRRDDTQPTQNRMVPVGIVGKLASRVPSPSSEAMYVSRQDFFVENAINMMLECHYRHRPIQYVGFIDYEVDVLHVDDLSCVAGISVFVKTEVKQSRDGKMGNIFLLNMITYDWYILEGRPAHVRVETLRRIYQKEVMDSQYWYKGSMGIVEDKHEEIFSDTVFRSQNQTDNIDAVLVSLQTKIAVLDSLNDDPSERSAYERNTRESMAFALDALLSLCECLLDAQQLGRLRSLARSADASVYTHIVLRSDFVFSQAATIAATAVMVRLTESWPMNGDKPADLLLLIWSFLSCYGDERGMLEDATEAWRSVASRLLIRLVRAPSSVTRTVTPLVSGHRHCVIVSLPLPQDVYDSMPNSLREVEYLRVATSFWSLGVNHEATIGYQFGGITWESQVNQAALFHLQEYAATRSGLSPATNEALAELDVVVRTEPSRKNMLLYEWAMAAGNELQGELVVTCKSGKDRTAMGVTLEQGRQLRQMSGLNATQAAEVVDALRKNGARREVCRKNIGKAAYSFSAFQMHFLPKSFRPPSGTYAHGLST